MIKTQISKTWLKALRKSIVLAKPNSINHNYNTGTIKPLSAYRQYINSIIPKDIKSSENVNAVKELNYL